MFEEDVLHPSNLDIPWPHRGCRRPSGEDATCPLDACSFSRLLPWGQLVLVVEYRLAYTVSVFLNKKQKSQLLFRWTVFGATSVRRRYLLRWTRSSIRVSWENDLNNLRLSAVSQSQSP